jgi:hypothetical protein
VTDISFLISVTIHANVLKHVLGQSCTQSNRMFCLPVKQDYRGMTKNVNELLKLNVQGLHKILMLICS